MFSGVISEGSLPERFLFAANAVSLKFPTHNSTVLRLGTLSFWWILKCRQNISWVTTTKSLFYKYVSTAKARCSTDQRCMATEMLWVSLEGRAQGQIPHANDCTHSCVTKSSRISAAPCSYRRCGGTCCLDLHNQAFCDSWWTARHLETEDGGTKFSRNFDNYSPIDMA